MELRELCKKRRDDLKITNQSISDQSGVPISTVNNFFSRNSSSPSVYTVGPICAVLGVSLDHFFTIGVQYTSTEAEMSAHIEDLSGHVNTAETTIRMLHEGIRTRNIIIVGLLLLVAGLCAWCIYKEAVLL